MSGHSKWANIKRKKAKVDAAKGSAFSRLTKEVMSAARQGGPNPETNFKLRLAVARARDANVPWPTSSAPSSARKVLGMARAWKR